MSAIRVLAVGIAWRDDEFLVGRGYDPVKDESFFRPLGGAIEFGERSRDAVRREFREELGTEIDVGERIWVTESIFEWNGQAGHEVVFVYDIVFRDERMYEGATVEGLEGDTPFEASWVTLESLASGDAPLYPEGLLGILRDRREGRERDTHPPR
jgi:ADP-ribose pyrophosphatase YjhB (NUDIX family)